MSDQDITRLVELLRVSRQNERYLLELVDVYGDELALPIERANSLKQVRAQIASSLADLRSLGVALDNAPLDRAEALLSPTVQSETLDIAHTATTEDIRQRLDQLRQVERVVLSQADAHGGEVFLPLHNRHALDDTRRAIARYVDELRRREEATADLSEAEVAFLRERLRMLRRNVADLQEQAATLGGVAFLPRDRRYSLEQHRISIAGCLTALRDRGVMVADEPEDSLNTPSDYLTQPGETVAAQGTQPLPPSSFGPEQVQQHSGDSEQPLPPSFFDHQNIQQTSAAPPFAQGFGSPDGDMRAELTRLLSEARYRAVAEQKLDLVEDLEALSATLDAARLAEQHGRLERGRQKVLRARDDLDDMLALYPGREDLPMLDSVVAGLEASLEASLEGLQAE